MLLLRPRLRLQHFNSVSRRYKSEVPLVSIKNATFYRQYPSPQDTNESNPRIFPGLDFSLPTNSPTSVSSQQHWAVLSPSSLARTTFLQILSGSYISLPPTARSFPYLSSVLSKYPSAAIHYIGFDADRTTPGAAVRGAYLSARYEAHREETDWTLQNYLTGDTELNPTGTRATVDKDLLQRCIVDLRLDKLLAMPVGNLSNGQTRRARIAKALLAKPEVLLLDGPFMGLDPPSVALLSDLLRNLATACRPRIVLSLRSGDYIPDWTSHLVAVQDTNGVTVQGPKKNVLSTVSSSSPPSPSESRSLEGYTHTFPPRDLGEPIVEITGASISYGPDPILGFWPGGLQLTVRRGQRLAVLGPNGSGKTTLLSLLTSDHPQTYAQPVKLFGRARLPSPGERGISVFELQRRIAHSSPEVHAFFPRHLTLRRALESAWADAPLARPTMPAEASSRVDAILTKFAAELGPPETPFGEASFSAQRLALFLRALVARQELVILDEAFSGMDRAAREKAFRFLAHELTDQQALIVIAHDRGDVPGCIREWLCLPEPAGRGQPQAPPRTGELAGPLELRPEAWSEIWGLDTR